MKKPYNINLIRNIIGVKGPIWTILQKDLRVELRKSFTISSIFLFVFILIFILYKAFNRMSGMEWNVMIWITTLFSGMNAIIKSFTIEKSDTKLYYYTLVSPFVYIIAKLLYNVIYLGLIFLIVYAGFSFFLGNPVKDVGIFGLGAMLGVLGLASIMTLVSSVAAESQGGGTLLMNILAMPLTIPVLLLLVKIGAGTMHLIQDTSVAVDLYMLAAIDMIVLGLTLILYNEVWRN